MVHSLTSAVVLLLPLYLITQVRLLLMILLTRITLSLKCRRRLVKVEVEARRWIRREQQ